MDESASPAIEHNHACESAAQADCKCRCHGAGHQHDLVARAASCPTDADFSSLIADLEQLLGGFHNDERDVQTPTRTSRSILSPEDAKALSFEVGRGATWLETLLVDEALHTAFVAVASVSLSTSDTERAARCEFVERLTRGAIPIVAGEVTAHTVVDSHVWCSIIAEYASRFAPGTVAYPQPTEFGIICYPRKSAGRRPPRLADVRAAGLSHVDAEFQATPVPAPERIRLLRLVGAATCPDLWHHPAAVRYCLAPSVEEPGWPQAGTTRAAVSPRFNQLRNRWDRKNHW